MSNGHGSYIANWQCIKTFWIGTVELRNKTQGLARANKINIDKLARQDVIIVH